MARRWVSNPLQRRHSKEVRMIYASCISRKLYGCKEKVAQTNIICWEYTNWLKNCNTERSSLNLIFFQWNIDSIAMSKWLNSEEKSVKVFSCKHFLWLKYGSSFLLIFRISERTSCSRRHKVDVYLLLKRLEYVFAEFITNKRNLMGVKGLQ